MQLGGLLRLPGRTFAWKFHAAFKPREGTKVLGVTNKVGHRYVPFFDYDTKEPLFVEHEIKSLQEEYLLGDAFLFRTGNGYHVILLDLLSGDEWRELLAAANCDENWKLIPENNGAKAWVLRTTPKKHNSVEYVKKLDGYLGRNLSRPHYDYLLKRGVPLADIERLRIYTTMKTEALIYATYEA